MTNNKHLQLIASKAAEYILQGYGEDLAIFKAFNDANNLCAEMIDCQTERAQLAKEVVCNKVYSALAK